MIMCKTFHKTVRNTLVNVKMKIQYKYICQYDHVHFQQLLLNISLKVFTIHLRIAQKVHTQKRRTQVTVCIAMIIGFFSLSQMLMLIMKVIKYLQNDSSEDDHCGSS